MGEPVPGTPKIRASPISAALPFSTRTWAVMIRWVLVLKMRTGVTGPVGCTSPSLMA